MSEITIPNTWCPRPYQRALYNAFGVGKPYQRGSVIWHRRAGKDSTVLNMTARDMFKRVGTYWHLFPEQSQARKAIWNGIDGSGQRIIDQVFPSAVRETKNEQEMLIRLLNGSTWQMAGSDNYNSLVGSNPVGVVFSEWSLANPAAWDYIRPILLENGGWALFITTPRGRNHAYETHMIAQNSDSWFDEVLTVDETGVLSEPDIESERAGGMSEAKIAQEYYCSFEAETDEQFIPSDAVATARKVEAHASPEDPFIIGVDPARFGGDKSAIVIRRGLDARTLAYELHAQADTMFLAGRVAEAIEKLQPGAVFIDEGGVGGGVVDRLKQLQFACIVPVNFGWTSDRRTIGAPAAKDKRSEMWASLREALKSGLAIADDDKLAFELLSPSYAYDAHNAIKLEAKDAMRARGVHSPDIADALALTYAYPVQPRSQAQRMADQAAETYDPIWDR